MSFYNYLIVGSGVAGLALAIKLADRFPDCTVAIITKANAEESNTKYAQGGVAVVIDKKTDSYQKHIKDTLICGDGLCNQKVVNMVVTEGPRRLEELINWGAQFDINDDGNLDLGKEGGHSEHRVVHHKDQTGHEIERAVLDQVQQKKNVVVLDYHFVIDLIIENNHCFGVAVLNQNTNQKNFFRSQFTILASGGIGHLYGKTTNPIIATGDGIAMASRAKAVIKDMEFIQFHPTALNDGSEGSAFLISEAVRGFGAYLRTKSGCRFMLQYDSRAELASRDIVSQSIDLELKKSGDECVYLDCTHLDIDGFKKHFPMIYDYCKSVGIDIEKSWIPVIPAQHYLCGGISVDCNGKTSIENLFACGECSQTGLHGANRLASNSLLEALVFSDKIYTYLTNANHKSKQCSFSITKVKFDEKPKIASDYCAKFKKELQFLMRQNAGIVRTDSNLLQAKKKLIQWQIEVDETCNSYQENVSLYELKNMITVGLLIVQHSIERKENRGGFFKI